MGSNDFSSRPTLWRRVARVKPPGKDVAGLLSQELRHVFQAVHDPVDLEGARRLLETLKKHRDH